MTLLKAYTIYHNALSNLYILVNITYIAKKKYFVAFSSETMCLIFGKDSQLAAPVCHIMIFCTIVPHEKGCLACRPVSGGAETSYGNGTPGDWDSPHKYMEMVDQRLD